MAGVKDAVGLTLSCAKSRFDSFGLVVWLVCWFVTPLVVVVNGLAHDEALREQQEGLRGGLGAGSQNAAFLSPTHTIARRGAL